MRTFPKSLAKLRLIVKERCEQLRGLSIEDLKLLAAEPSERIVIDARPSTVSVIVQPLLDGSLRVVVQGFMKPRLVPGRHVAIDGFYKQPDGRVTPLSAEDIYEFD